MRAIIVEHNKADLMILSRLANQVGNVLISPFSDPTEALYELGRNPCDLLLVGVATPQFDGLGFVRRARAIGADTPILFLAPFNDRAAQAAALAAGATDFLTRPIHPAEVTARVRNLLDLRAARLRARGQAAEIAAAVDEATKNIAARERELMLSIARAVEFRDGETGQHVERVAAISRNIGVRLGLSDSALDDLYIAAPLHDIGKIGVPDSILGKPGALTLEERALMQQHTLRGHAMLRDCRAHVLRKAADIALSHHERFDGAGYPQALRGEEIPLDARIVAVADVFDALSSRRPYKAAWEVGRAREYLRASAGGQFDPDCVAAFLDIDPPSGTGG